MIEKQSFPDAHFWTICQTDWVLKKIAIGLWLFDFFSSRGLYYNRVGSRRVASHYFHKNINLNYVIIKIAGMIEKEKMYF